MTDFKVKPGVDGFRFRARRYKSGDIISVQEQKDIEQLKTNNIVEEIKPAPKVTEQSAVSPAVKAWTKKAETSRKK